MTRRGFEKLSGVSFIALVMATPSFGQSVHDHSRFHTTSQSVTVGVGGDGDIRAQLTWRNTSDLDLHLEQPDHGVHVYYGRPTVSFNNGGALAQLDHDNLGGVIDVGPDLRVENIVVTGDNIPHGEYRFYVHDFSERNGQSPYNIVIKGDDGGQLQVEDGILQRTGDRSPYYTVNYDGTTVSQGVPNLPPGTLDPSTTRPSGSEFVYVSIPDVPPPEDVRLPDPVVFDPPKISWQETQEPTSTQYYYTSFDNIRTNNTGSFNVGSGVLDNRIEINNQYYTSFDKENDSFYVPTTHDGIYVKQSFSDKTEDYVFNTGKLLVCAGNCLGISMQNQYYQNKSIDEDKNPIISVLESKFGSTYAIINTGSLVVIQEAINVMNDVMLMPLREYNKAYSDIVNKINFIFKDAETLEYYLNIDYGDNTFGKLGVEFLYGLVFEIIMKVIEEELNKIGGGDSVITLFGVPMPAELVIQPIKTFITFNVPQLGGPFAAFYDQTIYTTKKVQEFREVLIEVYADDIRGKLYQSELDSINMLSRLNVMISNNNYYGSPINESNLLLLQRDMMILERNIEESQALRRSAILYAGEKIGCLIGGCARQLSDIKDKNMYNIGNSIHSNYGFYKMYRDGDMSSQKRDSAINYYYKGVDDIKSYIRSELNISVMDGFIDSVSSIMMDDFNQTMSIDNLKRFQAEYHRVGRHFGYKKELDLIIDGLGWTDRLFVKSA